MVLPALLSRFGVFAPVDVVYLALVLILLAVALWVFVFASQRRLAVRSLRVLTQIECPSCNFKEIRAFKEGDFVHAPGGPCRRCGKETIIVGIYTEEKVEE